MRLSRGTVDCLDPQCTLCFILRCKHHLVALANHVEEVPATFWYSYRPHTSVNSLNCNRKQHVENGIHVNTDQQRMKLDDFTYLVKLPRPKIDLR